MNSVKIALTQLEAASSIEENLEKALKAIDDAADNDAQLILFSEVHLSPFFPQYADIDASQWLLKIDSDPIRALQDKCAQRKIMAAPNVYLAEGKSKYDATLLIDTKGNILGTSQMVHIPQFQNFFEQDYYHPSDSGFKVYSKPIGRIGVIVCFDRQFPENFRSCVLQDADVILIPTVNTKAEPSKMFEWELRVSAMQNSVIVAMCNRVGTEDEMTFSGESIVVDANGEVIVKADDIEQILYANIDPMSSKSSRKNRNYVNLRRPDAYNLE